MIADYKTRLIDFPAPFSNRFAYKALFFSNRIRIPILLRTFFRPLNTGTNKVRIRFDLRGRKNTRIKVSFLKETKTPKIY